MSFVRERAGRDGKIRYQALYEDLKGRRRSAGTFATEKQAAKAGQRAEAIQTVTRVPERRVSRQTFKHYVKESWLPNHVVEATTRQNYTLQIDKRLIPEFGTMRMIDIMPLDVRQWITRMSDEGVKPPTIRYCMTILSAIFTTALNDQVIAIHPCKGVKTPPVPKKPRTIITPEQFDTIYKKLPDARSRLLVEVGVESGLRWGELTELRVRDIDPRTRVLTVSRAVVELLPEFHPTGGRFLVKDYPKDREYRRFKLSHQIVAKLVAHINAQALGRDDLLFSITRDELPRPALLKVVPDPDDLGFTEPNEKGRTYRHGTMSAYNAGRCRCDHCRAASARYRAERRAAGKDNPRGKRHVDTDGHIPRHWFRDHAWHPALKAAELDFHVRIHDLRHAHASWLLAGGADLEVVRDRLGHASIATTQKYLHTLPEADDTALDALSKIRNRSAEG